VRRAATPGHGELGQFREGRRRAHVAAEVQPQQGGEQPRVVVVGVEREGVARALQGAHELTRRGEGLGEQAVDA
jgi:hypothetical protein